MGIVKRQPLRPSSRGSGRLRRFDRAALGGRTVRDTSVHPPVVSHLHYVIDGWLGSQLLESFPCFIASDSFIASIRDADLTIADAEVELSSEARFLSRVRDGRGGARFSFAAGVPFRGVHCRVSLDQQVSSGELGVAFCGRHGNAGADGHLPPAQDHGLTSCRRQGNRHRIRVATAPENNGEFIPTEPCQY